MQEEEKRNQMDPRMREDDRGDISGLGSASAQDGLSQDDKKETPHQVRGDERVRNDESARCDKCQKCEEYLAGWKRAQADYANLKKEFEKTRSQIASLANEQLLYEMLPAIDQFEIALDHLPDISTLQTDDKNKIQNWITGIAAVKQLWEQTFKSIGLENVETNGLFDPARHEAAGQEEDVAQPPDAILKVIRPGWSINGKILRPAKVIVNSINN